MLLDNKDAAFSGMAIKKFLCRPTEQIAAPSMDGLRMSIFKCGDAATNFGAIVFLNIFRAIKALGG